MNSNIGKPLETSRRAYKKENPCLEYYEMEAMYWSNGWGEELKEKQKKRRTEENGKVVRCKRRIEEEMRRKNLIPALKHWDLVMALGLDLIKFHLVPYIKWAKWIRYFKN